VDIYATDEEKVEQLKKWWAENGRSLIVGVVIGIGAIFGWRAWVGYQSSQAEQASALYARMTTAMSQDEADTAIEEGREIINQFGKSPYAVFASMAMAKLKLERGEPEAAEAHLRWAMNEAEMAGLKDIARLRLARVLLSENKTDEALKLVSNNKDSAFAAAYAEVRGDIYRVKGDKEKAHSAYQQALDALEPGARNRTLIQMKLDEVGDKNKQEKS
jgi:predicted negative regulator of RcsB-dependent stress response